jgi:Fic family protein
MTYLDQKIRIRIDEKLSRLNSYRPLPELALRKIKEQFEIEMTYNSNAIEGNSLTLKETYLVINEGITIKGKSLDDHLEAKNHKEALDYLYQLTSGDNKSSISEKLIRSLNQIVLQSIDKQWAGRYRNSSVAISGAKHRPPEAIDIPGLMKDMIEFIKENNGKLHPIELSAIVHHKIVFIHPFFDGNGRTARLVMNILLMQNGFPLSIILKNDKRKYYSTLAEADKGDLKNFISFVSKSVERSLDIYLKTLTPIGRTKEKFVSLSELSEDTDFSPKYLNLLVRSGKLEAHKEGRNWISSKEALERYLENRERKR